MLECSYHHRTPTYDSWCSLLCCARAICRRCRLLPRGSSPCTAVYASYRHSEGLLLFSQQRWRTPPEMNWRQKTLSKTTTGKEKKSSHTTKFNTWPETLTTCIQKAFYKHIFLLRTSPMVGNVPGEPCVVVAYELWDTYSGNKSSTLLIEKCTQ